jgi:hypothetical protein
VKNKGSNLNTLALALLQRINCEPLQLTSPYASACFGHAMNKACQYTTSNYNVCGNDTSVVEKCPIQEFRQKIVTKPTNSGTRVVGLLVYFHTN